MQASRIAAIVTSGRKFAPPAVSTFVSTLAFPTLAFTSGAATAAVTPVVFSGGVAPYNVTVSPLIPGLTVRASDGQINAGTAGAVTATATYRFTGVDALSNTTFKDVSITITSATGATTAGPVAESAGISAAQWAEWAAKRPNWVVPNDNGASGTYAAPDNNNVKARIDALPTSGTTVSTFAAIQSALNAAPAGGAVFLTGGTYIATAPLDGIAGKKLIGVAGQTVTIDFHTNSCQAGIYAQDNFTAQNLILVGGHDSCWVTFNRSTGQYTANTLAFQCWMDRGGWYSTDSSGSTNITLAGAGGHALVTVESTNSWNDLGGVNAHGGNSDGIDIRNSSGNCVLIDVHTHNNGDDGIDMWTAPRTYHYFSIHHDNGKAAGKGSPQGDGNGIKLGVGTQSHCFYKTFSNDNLTGGWNLNGNTNQPVTDQCGASGNAGGNFINGVVPF